jgi:hypothetical protein
MSPHAEQAVWGELPFALTRTTQRKDIAMKNTKSAPASVSALLGKKLNKIHVLETNEKKSKPGKPVVHSKRLAHFNVADMAFLLDLS